MGPVSRTLRFLSMGFLIVSVRNNPQTIELLRERAGCVEYFDKITIFPLHFVPFRAA